MRTRGVLLASLWTLLSIAAAAVSTVRMQPLRRESDALLVSSRAHADAFASSFDGQFADRQLDTFQQRREVVRSLSASAPFTGLRMVTGGAYLFSSFGSLKKRSEATRQAA